MLDILSYSILIGIFAYVFINVLIPEGEVLGFYSKFLYKINKEWLRKPLGGCLQCFTGQFSLWSGAFYLRLNPFDLILFIALSIFTTLIIERFL